MVVVVVVVEVPLVPPPSVLNELLLEDLPAREPMALLGTRARATGFVGS